MLRGKILGRSFIIRKRLFKNRFDFFKGECFYGVNAFKYGVYVQHSKSRPIGFKNIKDVAPNFDNVTA